MEWMGHLQSHHTYRKHQLTSRSAADGKQHQQSPAVRRVVASSPSLFAGTHYSECINTLHWIYYTLAAGQPNSWITV